MSELKKKDLEKIRGMLRELISLNKNYTKKIESQRNLQKQKSDVIKKYLDQVL